MALLIIILLNCVCLCVGVGRGSDMVTKNKKYFNNIFGFFIRFKMRVMLSPVILVKGLFINYAF